MTVFLLKNRSDDSDHGRADPYEATIRDAQFVPVMDYHSINLDELRATLERVQHYDGIVVTSQRAVDAMKLELPRLPASVLGKPIYTVGPTTANRLQLLGFARIHGAESGSGTALAETMLRDLPANARLVFLAGEIHRKALPDRLRAGRHSVTTVIVYRTVPNANVAAFVSSELRSGDWVVFFSPSHTDEILNSLRATDKKYMLAAIGPTTKEFLEERGFAVAATALQPTADGLQQALQASHGAAPQSAAPR